MKSGSGTHFLFSHNSQLLPVDAVFSLTRTNFSANPSLRLEETSFLSTGNSIVLFQVFFRVLFKNCYWNLGEVNFKRRSIFLLLNTSFFIFSEILRFFNVEATFSYSGNVFFNKSFIRLVEMDFLSSGNSVFLIRAIFLLVEAIIGIRGGKQFSKKELIIASGQLIFWVVEAIFLSIF